MAFECVSKVCWRDMEKFLEQKTKLELFWKSREAQRRRQDTSRGERLRRLRSLRNCSAPPDGTETMMQTPKQPDFRLLLLLRWVVTWAAV